MEIKISEKSWHYRWLKYLTEKTTSANNNKFNPPQSICPYFWRFVWVNLFAFFILILLIFATVILLGPIWGGVGYYMTGHNDFIFFALLGALIWLFGIGSLVYLYYEDKVFDIESGVTNKELGMGGITVKAIYSIKNKVCPRITYEK